MNNDTAERWAKISGYKDSYEISDEGNIRSLDRYVDCHGQRNFVRGRILTKALNHKGYQVVSLSKAGKKKTWRVHVLVLESFTEKRPEGMLGCHNDGDKTNNSLGNLRWDNQANNVLDSVLHGTHNEARKTHCAQGHEFTCENTWYQSGAPNKRKCRECLRLSNKKRSAYRSQWRRNKRMEHIGLTAD